MMGSMFGAYAPPQGGGMFGQPQQQSPLMQMMGGGGGGGMNPQLLQLAQQLLRSGGPQQSPMGGLPGPAFPEQYNATAGSVPGTLDANTLMGVPPQRPGSPGAFGGIPPEILRILLGPRSI